MYRDYYQLKENPFNVTADPSFFFSSSYHNDAFSHLLYGIQMRKGILVITGEIGTGKTTLCKALLNQFDETVKSAFVLNPNFSDTQLLQFIIHDLGISGEFINKFALVTALNNFLLTETSEGHNVVIIIDEAQNLSISQLEFIRLLSNLETEKQKLLQIILVGQPELLDKLKSPGLRQLNQRISVRYHIYPLKKTEVVHYIKHRLQIATRPADRYYQRLTFTQNAIHAIYEYTQGTPRMINILCDRALLAGYVANTFTIGEEIIHQSAKEVFHYEYH